MQTHISCNLCGSSDAATDYGTYTYCFSCQKRRNKSAVNSKFGAGKVDRIVMKGLPDRSVDMPPEATRWLVLSNLWELADKYGLYYSDQWQRVIIPSYDLDDTLLGWQGRNVFENNKTKYLQSYQNKPILFYSKSCKDVKGPVFLVEDAASAMCLGEFVPTVALLSTHLDSAGKQLKRLLDLSDEFVVWFDKDRPGQEAIEKVAKRLSMICNKVHKIVNTEEPKLQPDLEQFLTDRRFI